MHCGMPQWPVQPLPHCLYCSDEMQLFKHCPLQHASSAFLTTPLAGVISTLHGAYVEMSFCQGVGSSVALVLSCC